MALMSYLSKDRHGTYHFRRVIPAELRAFMPAPWHLKANWKKSLGTKDPAKAKLAGSRCLRDCMIDFQLAEMRRTQAVRSELSEAEIEALAEWWQANAAGDDDDFRNFEHPEDEALFTGVAAQLEASGIAFEPSAGPYPGRGMSARQMEKTQEGAELVRDATKHAIARGDTMTVEFEVDELLAAHGIELPATSRSRRVLAMRLLEAQVSVAEITLKRLEGQVVKVPRPGPPLGDGRIIGGSALPTSSLDGSRGPLLSEAAAAWKAGTGARGGRTPSANTAREADYAVRRFIEWHGDTALGDISRARAREFRDALAALPTRLPKAVAALTLRELERLPRSDLAAYPRSSATTVNKNLQLLSAIVSHAEHAGSLDLLEGFKNPFGKGVKLDIDARKADAEQRQPFSAADLKALFASAVFTAGDRPAGGGGEAAFWLPILALLTGARQAELVQLRAQDLKQDPETGVWFFDISTEGGRSIKTASSRRKVPMHPMLEAIGLLSYRKKLLDDGAAEGSSLWPGIGSGVEARPGAAWSKWFSRHLRNVAGVKDRSKVFHSFRHTFKRMARDARISEEMHDALTGHSGGGVGRAYGGGFGLEALAREVGRIAVPEAVSRLRWVCRAETRQPYAMDDHPATTAPRPSLERMVEGISRRANRRAL